MKKLRVNATRMISSYTYGKHIRTLTPLEDMAVKYAQRTLLLEKAHRYQKAANMLLVEMVNACQRFNCSGVSPWGFSKEKHNATIEKLSQKRAWVMGTATALSEQAAAI